MLYTCVTYNYKGVDGFVYMYLNLYAHSHLHLCKSNTCIFTYNWYCIYPQLQSTCKVLGGPLQLVQLAWQNLTGKMRVPLREYPATVCSLSIPAYAVLVGTWWYKFGYFATGTQIFHWNIKKMWGWWRVSICRAFHRWSMNWESEAPGQHGIRGQAPYKALCRDNGYIWLSIIL